MKQKWLRVCIVLVAVAASAGIALAYNPPHGNNTFLPGPGHYHMTVSPPLNGTSSHNLDVYNGGGSNTPYVDGQPASYVDPPPGIKDGDGNVWFFYPDGTVWVLDTNNQWHHGTWQQTI